MADDKKKKGQFDLDKGGKPKFDLGKSEGKKFDLNKGEEKKFDLSKGETKKFDLDKDNTTVAVSKTENKNSTSSPIEKEQTSVSDRRQDNKTPPKQDDAKKVATNFNATDKVSRQGQANTTSTDEEQTKSSGKGKWIFAAVIILSLVVLGLWYANSGKGEDQAADGSEPENTVGAADSAKTSPDSTTTIAGGGNDQNVPTDNGNGGVVDNGVSSNGQTSGAKAETSNGKTNPSTDKKSPKTEEASKVSATATQEDANKAPEIPSSIEAAAREVISGKYGNNPERTQRLGTRYREIQKVVNDMYRTGKVQ